MQKDDFDKDRLNALIVKIKRLKKKLVSYGWNKQEATSFILYEFLKLPQPDWEDPKSTVTFYQIKQKYKAESSTSELLLCLQQIVPNLHCVDVLEYLHSVFQYSSINFGFDLLESSSDSGENPTLMKKHMMKQTCRPVRHKTKCRDSVSPPRKKKVHQEEKMEIKETYEDYQCIFKEEVKVVRKRKPYQENEFQEWDKYIKEDSP